MKDKLEYAMFVGLILSFAVLGTATLINLVWKALS